MSKTSDPRERLVEAIEERNAEPWTRVGLGVLALFAAGVFYLGSRPEGYGPIWVYLAGRFWIALAALLVVIYGVIRSARRPPFLQRARVRAFFALSLVVGVSNYPLPFPSCHEGHTSLVPFELPVEGEWQVVWGGLRKDVNRLMMFYVGERYGQHLVRVVDGSTHRGDGARAEDYYAFDQPVLAPAAGRVVVAQDGHADHPPDAPGRSGEPAGNHLVLEVAEGQFLLLTHLREGSLLVTVGEEVGEGRPVARCGSSGYSPLTPEPHVASYLADSALPRRGQPIPWRFHDYFADGERVESGLPRGGVARDGRFIGQRVWRAAAPEKP